jgi:hypothetical protein
MGNVAFHPPSLNYSLKASRESSCQIASILLQSWDFESLTPTSSDGKKLTFSLDIPFHSGKYLSIKIFYLKTKYCLQTKAKI